MKLFRAYLREDRLDEISKTTLASYIKKSSKEIAHHASAKEKVPKKDIEANAYHKGKLKKRLAGVRKATTKLKKQASVVKLPKPKPVKIAKPKKVAKKNSLAGQGVYNLISRGISSGIKKGTIGIVRKVLK
jgi:hypothetical protein